MYVVDTVDLKNRVAFSLILISNDQDIHKGKALADLVNAYTPIALEIILNCLNDKTYRNPADSLDVYIRNNRPDDTNTWALSELIEQTVWDIKREFYGKFGYDPRLYYKLQQQGSKQSPVYRFVMDLDRTFLDFQPKETAYEDPTQDVSENPSLEELNALFNRDNH